MYILPPLKLIFCQAMLNTVVYQMSIVTNVPVNSAALKQFMRCVTLLLILVDTGLKELYLPLLVRPGSHESEFCLSKHLICQHMTKNRCDPTLKILTNFFADCQNSANVQRSRSAASEATKFWQSRQFCLFNH